MKLSRILLAISAVLAAGYTHAEATYGYDAAAAGNVTANAAIRVTVNIPKLIVLKVGSTGPTIDNLIFNAVPALPGDASVLVNGTSNTTWTGAAVPTFTTNAVGAVPVSAWHNNLAGAQLTCSATTAFTGGLTSADVTVTPAGILHPGATTACAGAPVALTRNTLHTGTYTYALTAAALAAAAAGSDFEVVTYTATSL